MAKHFTKRLTTFLGLILRFKTADDLLNYEMLLPKTLFFGEILLRYVYKRPRY